LGAQTDYISGITAGQNLGGANLYGPGTAYKGMTKDQALALGLPEQVAEVEARQQVNMIQDGQGNKYYITSDPKNPKAYQVWDADGKDMGGLTAPGVLGLNKSTNDPGAWLVLSDQGIAQSGTTSTDGMKKANASTRVYDLNGAPGAGQVLDKGTVGTPQSTLLVEGAVTNALASDGKLGDLLNKQ
jgi:hypothetical protein